MNSSMSKDKQKPRLSFKELQTQIEKNKEKRDELNKKTKDYINTLQDVEKGIMDSLKVAKEVYKKKRNYFNEKVKKLKEKKDEYKELLAKLVEEKKDIEHLKRDNGKFKGFTSIKKLESKIEYYERLIETENLDITEENAIIDRIKELAQIKQDSFAEQQSSKLFRLERKIEIVKINLNKIYEQLNKWSNKSQSYHQKMHDSYQKVNELREKKNRMEEALIENKKKADFYHEKYLNGINQKKKLSKGRGRRPSYRAKPKKKQKYTPRQDPKQLELLEKIKQDKLAEALEKHKAGKKLNLFEARLILENNKS